MPRRLARKWSSAGRLSGAVDLPGHGETDLVTGALARFQGQERRPTSCGLASDDEGDIGQAARRGPASARLARRSTSMVLERNDGVRRGTASMSWSLCLRESDPLLGSVPHCKC